MPRCCALPLILQPVYCVGRLAFRFRRIWWPFFPLAFLNCLLCRYYGESQPANVSISQKNAKKDPAVYGYLTSEQALADFAELISYLKVKAAVRF